LSVFVAELLPARSFKVSGFSGRTTESCGGRVAVMLGVSGGVCVGVAVEVEVEVGVAVGVEVGVAVGLIVTV
jgi:hypothetical protein